MERQAFKSSVPCVDAPSKVEASLWRPALHDPADEFILELAVAAHCPAIVTHNVRDFGGAQSFDIAVLTPGEFPRSLRDVS